MAALEAERQARHCTWQQVADECGISASTPERMSQGKHPNVNGLAALAAWSGWTWTGSSGAPLSRKNRNRWLFPLVGNQSFHVTADMTFTFDKGYSVTGAHTGRLGARQ